MRKILRAIVFILLITGGIMIVFYFLGVNYKDEIYMLYRDKIAKVQDNIKLDKNKYYKDKDYTYVQNTNDFVAKDKKHLLNIFYTVVNSGNREFTFYCDKKYTNCQKDVVELVEDKDIISNINNFVHPYNSFEKINTSYDKYGEIKLEIDKVYTDTDINKINDKVKDVISKETNDKMTNKQKITKIHNYIINNGKYATDSVRAKSKDKTYNKANDILLDGYGLCSAYSDAMAIFLYELGIDNYKIASDSHIWNLVNVDKKWLHLDLTWDDPITQSGKDKLETMFLLIDNKKLKELKVEKHDYNKDVYKEAA